MTDPNPNHEVLQPGAVAVATGAASGIGRVIVAMPIGRGARVVCVGRDRWGLDDLAAEFADNALPLGLDLDDGAAVRGFPESLPEDWRAIDILVDNAGRDAGGWHRFHEIDLATPRR